MHSSVLSMVSRQNDPESENKGILMIHFLGLVINYFLWGAQVTQSYNYYRFYGKMDDKWLKCAVGLLFITEAIQSISVSSTSWAFFVERSGDLPGSQQFSAWQGNVLPFIDALTASIVHVFYAQKIWRLLASPYNYVCTTVVLTLSCLQCAAGLGCTIFMFSINMTLPEFERIKTWACIWLITAAVTDIIITAIMTWKLSHSRTGIKDTDDIISKLMRLIIETGLATAIVQLTHITIYLIFPLKYYYVAFAVINPKFYSNSMLVLLNSRRPRATSETWDLQGKMVDNHIHTSKIEVTSDHEVDEHSASRQKDGLSFSMSSHELHHISV